MSVLTNAIRQETEYAQLLSVIGKDFRCAAPQPILVNGLPEGGTTAMLVSLLEDLPTLCGKPTVSLIVCAEEKDCTRLAGELSRFGLRVAFFVGRDLTFYSVNASHEFEHERLDVLFRLQNGLLDAVITTPETTLGYTMPPKRLTDSTIRFDITRPVDLNALISQLLDSGYHRVDMVDGKGQFAVRGGIVDIYPPNGYYVDRANEKAETTYLQDGSYALRMELFDNEIDRLGLFDVDSQRFTENLSAALLPPAREVLLRTEDKEHLLKIVTSQKKETKNPTAVEELEKEITAIRLAIEEKSDIAFADKYLSVVYPEKACLWQYFPDRSAVFIVGTNNVNERLKATQWQSNQAVEELVCGETIAAKYAEYTFPMTAFDGHTDNNVTVHVDSLSYGLSSKKLAGLFGFRAKQTVSYFENTTLLQEELKTFLKQNYRVILMTENEMSAGNWQGHLNEQGIRAFVEGKAAILPAPGEVCITYREQVTGYELIVPKIVLLSVCPDARRGIGTNTGKLKKHKTKQSASETILSYADLEPGAYVVHENYGIGKYIGIEQMNFNGVKRDYISIQYDGEDHLYVPTDQLGHVSRYISPQADEINIKLAKLCGDAWKKTKAKTIATVKNIAKQLIQLYAQRERLPGFAFPQDDEFQRSFDDSFEYDETECQIRAVEDVKKDMMRPVPMDRLLCGDVGFGKTEVALRAAYKAVLGGKQVAVLVPTTILALQHYQTFVSRMRAFGVHIDMISRFKTTKEQAQSLRALKRGDTDILIGTHRLIGKGIDFKDLGLLIIDEEQRFGVEQKEKLKMQTGNVDVLALSATPIPRTLNMTMGGLRDISVLDEAPGDRLPVQTYVLEDDDLIIFEAIRKELRRGGQVFYLHNTVETIDLVAGKIKRAIPDANVVTAHGQMDKSLLEDIWAKMLSGEIDILVCTTIIETGIDVSNANTLIVSNAHRLGLSQLHQLRGRVGRSSRRAYAYFTYPRGMALTEIAQKRLEAIRDYAEFGAGFKIAMRDMEIRGAGNLLGTEQHGHLNAVGYELFIKLLNDAVLEEKGQKTATEEECNINLLFNAFIPEGYVQHAALRMELYKRIALIATQEDKEDRIDELIDRFGELPEPVENLLDIALIHSLGKECCFSKIRQSGEQLVVDISKQFVDFPLITRLCETMHGSVSVKHAAETTLTVRPVGKKLTLAFVQLFLEKYLSLKKEKETLSQTGE